MDQFPHNSPEGRLSGSGFATPTRMFEQRWQIELAFKRLKSLLQLGHLKKTDSEGAKAWLQGKLWVAVLIEMLIAVGERFSPWGYVYTAARTPLPLARMGAHALLVGPGGKSSHRLAPVAAALEPISPLPP